MSVAAGVWLATAGVDDVPARPHRRDLARVRDMTGRRTREFLAARGLLRALLATVRTEAADADIDTWPSGKPRVAGHPDLDVSVSHDGGTVAAAVAVGRSVGVDVQHPRDRPSRTVARRLLHGRLERFDELPVARAARELAWVWTAQEACVKATGQGIAGRPWTIDVPLGARSGHWRGLRWIGLRDRSVTPLSCAFTARADEGPGAVRTRRTERMTRP